MLPEHTSFDELLEIKKAFEANTASTGASPFVDGTSGGALSRQSLDTTFVALVSTDRDFKFLKQLPRRDVKQVISEYNINRSHGGGWTRSSYIGQSDEPVFADAIIQRLFAEMNYLSEGYSFNKVIENTDTVQDPEIIQANAALRRLAESMNRNFFFGNRSVNPNVQDGFISAIQKEDSSFVFDARGQLLDDTTIKEMSAQIRTTTFGVVDKLWMAPETKALYDQNYAILGKQTVFQNAGDRDNLMLGNIVMGIADGNAHNNKIVFEDDIWLDRHKWSVPMRWDQASRRFVEGASGENAPNTPTLTVAAVAPSVPNSRWDASYAGAYQYRVSAGNFRFGYSMATASANATVAINGAVQLTMTPSATGTQTTSFAIFRNNRAGSNVMRYLDEVRANTVGATTYTDLNENIPGTTIMILGDFNSRSNTDETRTHILSELLPPFKTLFPYGSGNKLRTRLGMVEAYNVLQILAPAKFRVIRNVPVLA
jgi:hypothetical protein